MVHLALRNTRVILAITDRGMVCVHVHERRCGLEHNQTAPVSITCLPADVKWLTSLCDSVQSEKHPSLLPPAL